MPKILIVGCGSIGKRHIGNLVLLGEKDLLVFDTQRERLEEIKSLFTVSTFTDLEKAFAEKPEVALITAPTSLHLSLALKAADRGCHPLRRFQRASPAVLPPSCLMRERA